MRIVGLRLPEITATIRLPSGIFPPDMTTLTFEDFKPGRFGTFGPRSVTRDVDVVEARASKSRPETGIVTFKSTARNAAGQALCEMTSPIIVARAGVAAER